MDLFTRLKALCFRNFRSFREEQSVSFPATGLYLVRGENEETDGASGAGKTNFIKAIAYAGGYESLPASKLKCWTADGAMAVSMELVNEHGTGTIRRGTKTAFAVNGEATKGGSDAQEFAFTDFVGALPADVLSAVTYRAQKKPGLFLSRPDSERKSFLTTLLGLVEFEDGIGRATKRAGELDVEAKGFEGAFNHNTAELERRSNPYKLTDARELEQVVLNTGMAVETLGEKIVAQEAEVETMRQVLGAALADAKRESDAAVAVVIAERDAARAARKPFVFDDTEVTLTESMLARAEATIRELETAARQRQILVRDELSAFERQATQIAAKVQGLDRIEVEQNRIAEELRKIRDDALCPTCERKWEHGPAKALADKLDRDFHANEIIIAQVQIEAAELPELYGEIEARRFPVEDDPMLVQFREARTKLQHDVVVQRTHYQQAQSQHDAGIRQEESEFERRLLTARLADRSTVLNSQARPVIEEKLREVSQSRRALDAAVRGLQSAQSDLQKVLSQNEVAQKLEVQRVEEVARYREAVEKNKTDLVNAVSAQAAELDYAAMLKSFLTAFFNEVLEEIAAEANSILARVPNVAHITLRFDEKVTARGTQIGTAVFINGEERTLADLSGGMETAVDLAVDLAVSAVVARRTGGRMPGWLVLDEPFTGLDSVCKEACMEILRDAAQQRLILVVDHAAEFKEMFSQFVTVSFKNGESRIVEAT